MVSYAGFCFSKILVKLLNRLALSSSYGAKKKKCHTSLQYFGGTNFGRTAGGPLVATSYDYDAPIDEYGKIIQLLV